MLRKDGQVSTRDLLILPTVLVLVLVEVHMNTGAWRVLYPLLAVGLLSPFAQKLWAAILISRVVLTSIVSWPPLDQLMSSDFLIIRTVFVWIMLVQNKLLSANRAVQLAGRALSPRTRVLKKLLIAAVIAIVLGVSLFNVPQPHVNLLLAAFLVYVVKRTPKAAPRERTRTGAAEVALVMASVLVFLALFELAARLFLPSPPGVQRLVFRPHGRAGYCLAENTQWKHTTNEFSVRLAISDQGFRDRHFDEKDDFTYRILCVGDSFTLGTGVALDETYAKVLERLLAQQNLTKRLEVINGGTSGYTIWQELIMLEERGFTLEPDMVILAMHPVSDIPEALGGRAPWGYEVGAVGRILLSMCKHSYAFAFVRDRCSGPWQRLVRCLRPHPQELLRRLTSTPPDEQRPYYWLDSNLKTYPPEVEQQRKLVEKWVCKMGLACGQRGIEFVVFAIPGPYEISPDSYSKWVPPDLDPELYDMAKTSRVAKEICERNGLEFVKLYDRFRQEHDRENDLYYKLDGHWTAKGHGLCAEIICEHLLKTHLRELVPASRDRTDG